MKKTISLFLIIAVSVILGSCEQARTLAITYKCLLTHYYSRHTADYNIVKTYINSKSDYTVGSSFLISINGKNDEACYEEGDSQARTYFSIATSGFNDTNIAEKVTGEETCFEYSFCRITDAGDTLKIASYRYNMGK